MKDIPLVKKKEKLENYLIHPGRNWIGLVVTTEPPFQGLVVPW